MAIVWTDDLKDRVRALWPTHSSREISDTISRPDSYVSRQSVSALAARIGLTSEHKTRDTNAADPFGTMPDGRVRKAPLQEPLVSRFYAEDVSATNVHGVAALESHHCRFIINTDMTAPVYCGAAITHDRFSWCQKHFEICRGLGTAVERRAA